MRDGSTQTLLEVSTAGEGGAPHVELQAAGSAAASLAAVEAEGAEPLAREARVVGPYRLLDMIGEGAMGVVYRAQHVTLGRHVAVKILRPEMARSRLCVERFFAEARAANQVCNEHVVEVTDLCRDADGTAYLVMELLEGECLANFFARDVLGIRDSLRVAQQLAETLAEVHAAEIVHRDLKPENVFLTWRQGEIFVKLLDFGVAKLLREQGADRTRPGMVVGTPSHMAPEQVTADPVDHRADIHALGVLLFELLTGRPPFEGATMRELLVSIAVSEAPRLSDRAALPESIRERADALVADCLRKEPAQRPRTGREVAVRIGRILEDLEAQEGHAASWTADLPPDADRISQVRARARASMPRSPAPAVPATEPPAPPALTRSPRAAVLGWTAASVVALAWVVHTLWGVSAAPPSGSKAAAAVSRAGGVGTGGPTWPTATPTPHATSEPAMTSATTAVTAQARDQALAQTRPAPPAHVDEGVAPVADETEPSPSVDRPSRRVAPGGAAPTGGSDGRRPGGPHPPAASPRSSTHAVPVDSLDLTGPTEPALSRDAVLNPFIRR